MELLNRLFGNKLSPTRVFIFNALKKIVKRYTAFSDWKNTYVCFLYSHFLKKARVYCCYPCLSVRSSVRPKEKFVTWTPSTS